MSFGQQTKIYNTLALHNSRPKSPHHRPIRRALPSRLLRDTLFSELHLKGDFRAQVLARRRRLTTTTNERATAELVSEHGVYKLPPPPTPPPSSPTRRQLYKYFQKRHHAAARRLARAHRAAVICTADTLPLADSISSRCPMRRTRRHITTPLSQYVTLPVPRAAGKPTGAARERSVHPSVSRWVF